MTLGLIGWADEATACTQTEGELEQAEGTLAESLTGRISRKVSLQPGASATVIFVITWHFPNFYSRGCGNQLVGHQYASRFDSAYAVAQQCKAIAEKDAENILDTYNGEYFIQIDDPSHAEAIGVGNGCYIDQVFGQTWAHWVGLGYLFDRDKQLSALRAL